MIPSITDAQVFKALGDLLDAILPAGTPSIIGQVNRVAPPEGNFCVMWSLRRPRLATNYETATDTIFTASIAPIDGSTSNMTVASSPAVVGTIEPGNQVFGVGVANSTTVQSQTSGTPGGDGVYVVSNAQTVVSEEMSAGVLEIAQSTEVVIQIDVHGPNSADNAQVINTIMRSPFAVDFLEPLNIFPLYADDPRQAPFTPASSQFEERWMVDVHLQITPSVSTPQQFSDSFTLDVVDVDVAPFTP